MNDHIKRMLYLSEYHGRANKSVLKERVEVLLESKQSEAEAVKILNAGNNLGDDANMRIVSKFKEFDMTKTQTILPMIAKAYIEKGGERGMGEIKPLFLSLSEMVKTSKVSDAKLNERGQYVVGAKTFDNFIKLAEYVHGIENMSKGYADYKGSITVDTEAIPFEWSSETIKVYDGMDVGKCIKYGSGGLTGKNYSFCIGQMGSANAWQGYRDTQTSTFYYVVDTNRDLSDPLHIVVVDHTETDGILLTDANNKTGNIAEYGDDVESYFKYLQSKGIDTKNFKMQPKTPEEEAETAKLGEQNTDLDWFKELTWKEKSKYIGRGHLLSDEQFKYLWNFLKEKSAFYLLSQYVDMGQAIPEEQFKILVGE